MDSLILVEFLVRTALGDKIDPLYYHNCLFGGPHNVFYSLDAADTKYRVSYVGYRLDIGRVAHGVIVEEHIKNPDGESGLGV